MLKLAESARDSERKQSKLRERDVCGHGCLAINLHICLTLGTSCSAQNADTTTHRNSLHVWEVWTGSIDRGLVNFKFHMDFVN